MTVNYNHIPLTVMSPIKTFNKLPKLLDLPKPITEVLITQAPPRSCQQIEYSRKQKLLKKNSVVPENMECIVY